MGSGQELETCSVASERRNTFAFVGLVFFSVVVVVQFNFALVFDIVWQFVDVCRNQGKVAEHITRADLDASFSLPIFIQRCLTPKFPSSKKE